ncbi:MAG: hypothetical protein ACE5I7_11900 [Candidatus Binatia bacterium]
MNRKGPAAAVRATLCILAFSGMLMAREVSAITIAIGTGSAAAGESADICVYMSGGNERVAGVQMQLRWDGTCAAVNGGSGTSADCRANPDTGKNVQTSVGQGPCSGDPDCLTALLFSLSDTNPVPDGPLFCCGFSVVNPPSGQRCDIAIGGVVLSDAAGQRVPGFSTQNGSLYVTTAGGGGGGQAPAAPARGAPAPRGRAAPPGLAPGAPAAGPRAPAAGAPAAGARVRQVPEQLEEGLPAGALEAPEAAVPPTLAPQGTALPPRRMRAAKATLAPERTTPAAHGTPTPGPHKTVSPARSRTVQPTQASTPVKSAKAHRHTRMHQKGK